MVVQYQPSGTALLDVLDRVLDKGIVIDAWIRFQLVGIDLITVDARVIVASIETYLKYAEPLGRTGLVGRPELLPLSTAVMTARRSSRRVRTPRKAA